MPSALDPADSLVNSDRSERRLRWFGVAFAIGFPTLITWVYFVLADRLPTGVQQSIYVAVKAVQFGFPLAWAWLALREKLQYSHPSANSIVFGIVFSGMVVFAGWLLFHFALRDLPVFADATPRVHAKITEFGIDAVWKYVLLGVFYSLVHSLLEEYYWRCFVFRQLRLLVPMWPAALLSSLAFMGHHVVVLREFFADAAWLAWLLSAAVAVGGVFWCWLYERSSSIVSTWISHLLIDAGIFWVGYELIGTGLRGQG